MFKYHNQTELINLANKLVMYFSKEKIVYVFSSSNL